MFDNKEKCQRPDYARLLMHMVHYCIRAAVMHQAQHQKQLLQGRSPDACSICSQAQDLTVLWRSAHDCLSVARKMAVTQLLNS